MASTDEDDETTLRHRGEKSRYSHRNFFGNEPPGDRVYGRQEFATALNWYHGSLKDKVAQGRQFIENLLKSENRFDELKRFRTVPDTSLNLTCAWLARLIGNGVTLEEGDIRAMFERWFSEQLRYAAPEAPVAKVRPAVKVMDRLGEVLDLFEDAVRVLDKSFNATATLTECRVNKSQTDAIIKYFAPAVIELTRFDPNNLSLDTQRAEAYTLCGKRSNRSVFDFLVKMLTEVKNYGSESAPVIQRKPRKKRAVDPVKRLKNIQFKAADEALKVKSIDPKLILGSQELWTYNVKANQLSVFKADNEAGLDIKGTTVYGYKDGESQSKKLGRRPGEYLEQINAGKIARRKLMASIKGDSKPPLHRLNGDTLLLYASK